MEFLPRKHFDVYLKEWQENGMERCNYRPVDKMLETLYPWNKEAGIV